MPICKREGFENVSSRNKNETFQDHEEVFFCEVTKEIFRDYDDYFRHVMVINSTVWMCEATGRDNLTYAEALKSERRARKIMEQFKDSLRPAVMMVIDQAKQSSLNALHTMVSKFLRRRFFINEEVTANNGTNKYNTYKVAEILPPADKSAPAGGVYEETTTLLYKLQRIGSGGKAQTTDLVIVPFEKVRRQRFEFTSENLELFIKSNVTRSEGILRPKPESYKQYVTDRKLTFAGIFIGKMPHFTPAKIRRPPEAGSKKQSTLNNYLVKDGDATAVATAAAATKTAAKLTAKAKAEAKAKSLKEEMERVRLERQERLAEQERLRAEKRAKLLERIGRECTALLTITDDLERNDQRPLPALTPIETYVPTKLLGDAFMLREFMQSFAGILSGMEAFRNKFSFYELSRAFTLREVAGPLADMTLILLGTIFEQLRDEYEECKVQYLLLRQAQRLHEPQISMSQAGRTHFYCARHFGLKLHELPLDPLSLSEVLRLHLLSSGAFVADRAEKWRINSRNGYVSAEDPGLMLRMQHPHILRALKLYTLYQLPFVDIMRVLRCLMAQVLTYPTALGLLEERMEEMAEARADLRALNMAEHTRMNGVLAQKRSATNEHNQQCMGDEIKNDPDKKRQLEEKLAKRLADIQWQSDREHKKHTQQVDKLQTALFNYMVYMGMDRAYRKYYVLESMPGIFVEHPADCMDSCLSAPPLNATPSALLAARRANMPRNRKDLRNYLLRLYTDEEKRATLAKNNAKLSSSTTGQENKENQANGALTNGLTNGHAESGEEGALAVASEDVAATAASTAEASPSPAPPTQYELLMCTGDPRNCIVHDERNADRQRWAYLYESDDIDALIESLNPLGEREAALRDQLTQLRTLILNHVRECPVDMLSVNSKLKLGKFKAAMKMATARKYTNYGMPEGTDLNEVLQFNLTERILQFEMEIYTGHLGQLKVKDLAKWRDDVQNNTYDAQCKLQWGPAGQMTIAALTAASGTDMAVEEDDIYMATTAGAAGAVAAAYDEENNADDATELSGRYTTILFRDPGEGLGDTKEIDSEDSADEGISLHDSHTLRANVRSLASALLQVEQSIERRFIKEPYGVAVAKELKKKKPPQDRRLKDMCSARLKQWEVSLMESVSYSQVLLHLNLLHDSILWARSTNRSLCQICRRGTDPDQMLLCDECNGGTHMFCMKPKMKTVPEGNWYCKHCVRRLNLPAVPDDTKKKTQRRVSARRSDKRLRSDDIAAVLETDDIEADSDSDAQSDGDADSDAADEQQDEEDVEELDNDEGEEEDDVDAAAGDDEDMEDAANDDDDDEDAASEAVTNNTETGEADTEAGSVQDEDDEDVCIVCSYDGSEVFCTRCKDNFHLECINLKRPPRYSFLCAKCKTKDERKRKTRQNDDSDMNDDNDTESSEPLIKRPRQSRSSLRLPNGVASSSAAAQQPETRSNGQRRSNRRTGDNLPLNSPLLYRLLDDVMKQEKAWPFLRPVTQAQVPDYHEIIRTPMDFAKVKSKLNTGAYQLNEEVMNDIQLIFGNCDQYNNKGNEVYQAGAALEKFVIARCKDLGLPFKPSDMND